MEKLGVLVTALAYSTYCQELPPDLRAKVDSELQTLTPDQRWRVERAAGNPSPLAERDVSNFPPSVREKMREQFHQQHLLMCLEIFKDVRTKLSQW